MPTYLRSLQFTHAEHLYEVKAFQTENGLEAIVFVDGRQSDVIKYSIHWTHVANVAHYLGRPVDVLLGLAQEDIISGAIAP